MTKQLNLVEKKMFCPHFDLGTYYIKIYQLLVRNASLRSSWEKLGMGPSTCSLGARSALARRSLGACSVLVLTICKV